MADGHLRERSHKAWHFVDTKVSSVAVAMLFVLLLGGAFFWGFNQASKANNLQTQLDRLEITAATNRDNIDKVRADAAISATAAKNALKIIDTLPASDAIITAYVQEQNIFFAYFACVVQHGPPACGPVPTTPSLQNAVTQARSSSPTSFATTTTTTVPRHGHSHQRSRG